MQEHISRKKGDNFWKKTVGAKLSSYQAQIMATFHAQQDGSFALTEPSSPFSVS